MPLIFTSTTRGCLFLLATLGYSALGCSKEKEKDMLADTSVFAAVAPPVMVETPIAEASGIADCTKSKGSLWVIEDSGNPPQLILLDKNGKSKKTILLENATNTDWEEMALVDGNIFIGDTGDNSRARQTYTIYQLPEPSPDAQSVANYNTIRFTYPDGSHDSEGFVVDPVSKDILIITKTDQASLVYKLAYPYSTTSVNTLTLIATLPFNGVTSAAISKDGKEILLKTYTQVFYYTRNPAETIAKELTKTPVEVPYRVEPQGEAVTFADDNSGFYSLSEKGMSSSVQLYFYRRN